MPDDNPLRDLVRDVIHNKGFEPPLFAVSVGVNGGMMYSSIVLTPERDMLQTDLLADYYPDGEIVGLKSPVNIMITDKWGRRATVTVGG